MSRWPEKGNKSWSGRNRPHRKPSALFLNPRRATGTGVNPRTLAEVLNVFLPVAFTRGIPVVEACSNLGWGSSSFVLETMPSLVYVLMRHGDNFEEAVVKAANDTHELAAHTREFRGVLTPITGALYDQRWYKAM